VPFARDDHADPHALTRAFVAWNVRSAIADGRRAASHAGAVHSFVAFGSSLAADPPPVRRRNIPSEKSHAYADDETKAAHDKCSDQSLTPTERVSHV
jgi:hypothetical protein